MALPTGNVAAASPVAALTAAGGSVAFDGLATAAPQLLLTSSLQLARYILYVMKCMHSAAHTSAAANPCQRSGRVSCM